MTKSEYLLSKVQIEEAKSPDTVVRVSEEQYDAAVAALSEHWDVRDYKGDVGVSTKDKDIVDKVLTEAGISGYQISE